MSNTLFLLLLTLLAVASATVSNPTTTTAPILKSIQNHSVAKKHFHLKTPKVKIHCTTKCMDKVKSKKVQKCKKVYQKGALFTTCSIKKIKSKCSFLCSRGKGYCFNKCKKTTCAGKPVTICKKHCVRGGSHCKRICAWKKERRCIQKRLPGKWLKECRSILVSKKFKSCMKHCIKKIPKLTCGQKCKNIHVPYKYQKCLNVIFRPAKDVRKCSLDKCVKKCKSVCKGGKKVCFRKCHLGTCDGKQKTFCKFTCTTTPKVCKTKCAFKEQIKCYIKRLPAKYMELCSDVLAFKNVNRCLKKCVYRNVVVSFKYKVHHKSLPK